ncbi:MAG: DegT/DnrJ/EryC1/StrS family aminotransferase [Prevotella sp.]|nr:DegT/DnrJ/EryC1/StrS family aminotransferase [Prevotella sp.]
MGINVTHTSMPSFEEYCEEIRKLWDSHYLTNMGVEHQLLKSKLQQFLKTPLAHYANGHLALEAALAVLDLPKGGEVITTPFTFASTTHAIVRKGLKPVFCDIRPDDATMDPEKAAKLVNERTVALLPVHVYGNVCDVDAFDNLARQHRLKVVYDAAHAFGVTFNGVPAVTFGDLAILSFHATKVFSTVEGGAVCFHDTDLEQRLADEANFGIRGTEHCAAAGGNGKMNELEAAMGLCNLRHFHEEVQRRKKVAMLYDQRLNKSVVPVKPREGVMPNYSYYPVLLQNENVRDNVYNQLLANDIHARKYFYPLTSNIPCHSACNRGDTPVAENIAQRILALPIYASLALEDVERICKIVNDLS